VVRALIDKPARIDTPMGTLSEVGNYLAPKLSRRMLHQMHLGYPDSAAARGAPLDDISVRRPKPPARAARSLRVPRTVSGPVRRVVRLVPGVHW